MNFCQIQGFKEPMKRLLRPCFALTLFAVCFLAQGAGAAPAPQNVLRATLGNGLRVIIVRTTLAPVVSTAVNYLVGSDEAPPGFPGMAHAQEHMMFRGSPGLSADQLANIGSIMGGNFNANTRESLTQYLYTVPSEDLDVALHIEALRMQDVNDDQKEWDKERGAIEQEVASDMSNPAYRLYTRLRAGLFAGTPYAHDALGTRASFNATSAAMLKKFHDTWYAPNNAILVIVGNLDPKATLATVRALFGPIKPKDIPAPPKIALQPVRPAAFTVPTDRPDATQILAMRMPGLSSPDFPALELLADILSSDRFALHDLVTQGVALNTEFALDPLPKAGLAYAVVTFPPDGDVKAIDAKIRAILSKVVKDGVSPDLLAAAKLQERRQTEFQKNSIAGLASVWSDAVALYGLRSPEEDLARIEKVTLADVNRVARKYLDLDHATSATLMPQGSGAPVVSSASFGGAENISLGEAKPTTLPAWAESARTRLVVPPSTTHPVVTTLPNGLTLIVQPEDVSDTVTIVGHIRNRPQTEEAPGREGVAMLLQQLFPYGSTHLDRIAFQKALDEIGASETAGSDFGIKILAQDMDRGIALLSDNELHPALPLPAFEILRRQIAQSIAARDKSPGYLTQRALRQALFPATDPSLRDATPQSVSSLTLQDVRNYYERIFRPDMTTIVVIGNVTPAAARAAIEKYFGSWKAVGPKPQTDLPVAPPNKAAVIAVPDASRVQDTVILAHTLALNRSSPDYYALALGDAVLSGGLYSSRLSDDLRKNAGLVYSVGSVLEAGRTRANYFIEYACDPQNVSKAAAIATRDLQQMQTVPVDGAELTRAKALLLRQIPLRESSISAIAREFLAERELDLPLDEPIRAARRYIALSAAAVQAAFHKWMRPGGMVRVSQGPAPQ
jgi:zinc protease